LAAVLALTILVTGKKHTDTENALWTFILFALGAALSFYFGRKSVKDAANELVRPQARGAARRLITLGRGVGMFETLIERQRMRAQEAARESDSVPLAEIEVAYDVLLMNARMQVRTISDALEDWREFEPEIVNQLVEDELSA
jgi:hypothetical protein